MLAAAPDRIDPGWIVSTGDDFFGSSQFTGLWVATPATRTFSRPSGRQRLDYEPETGYDDPDSASVSHVVMLDPEGNEFCVA